MKPGDKVQLVSGSQEMTVLWVDETYAFLAWWDNTKKDITTRKLEKIGLVVYQ